jgi:hypothetical protein
MATPCDTIVNEPVIIAWEAIVAEMTENTRIGHRAQSGTA